MLAPDMPASDMLAPDMLAPDTHVSQTAWQSSARQSLPSPLLPRRQEGATEGAIAAKLEPVKDAQHFKDLVAGSSKRPLVVDFYAP